MKHIVISSRADFNVPAFFDAFRFEFAENRSVVFFKSGLFTAEFIYEMTIHLFCLFRFLGLVSCAAVFLYGVSDTSYLIVRFY